MNEIWAIILGKRWPDHTDWIFLFMGGSMVTGLLAPLVSPVTNLEFAIVASPMILLIIARILFFVATLFKNKG